MAVRPIHGQEPVSAMSHHWSRGHPCVAALERIHTFFGFVSPVPQPSQPGAAVSHSESPLEVAHQNFSSSSLCAIGPSNRGPSELFVLTSAHPSSKTSVSIV